MSIVLGHWHRLLHVRALLARWNGGEQEICQVHSWLLFDSQLLHQERSTPRSPLREERSGSRVVHRESAQEEMQEERFLGYSRPVHPWWKIPQKTWSTWVAVKKYVVRWTNWRTKTTRTTSLQMKFECIETIGGSVRILLVPTRCPWGIELISKKHCLPCDLKDQEDQAFYQKWQSNFLILVELARILVAFFIWASPRRWTQHWLIAEAW